MRFTHYLKDKTLSIAIMLIAILGVAFVLRAFALDAGAITFICAFLIAALALGLIVDYLRRRSFYRTLAMTLEKLDEAYLITELIDRPGFTEGELFYDALAQAVKAMNDKIGTYRTSSEEYREYIETWIHEIKTPLAAAHLIAENHDGYAVQSMNTEVNRIEGYVEQALFYSRSTNLEKDFSIKQENLGDMVRETLRRNARTLIDAGIAPKMGDLDFTVYADSKWVVFVLGQILGNSAKYRKDKGIEGDQEAAVTLTAKQYDTGLDTVRTVLTVSDNGIGIPASDIDRVFDKGFTGENGRIFAKSTGIGLYLCHQLCTKMGLSIELDSLQGQGTQVKITFPQNKMHFVK